MNKSKTPTSEKIGIPLRLEPALYEKMMDRVQKEKKNQRGYSVNQAYRRYCTSKGWIN